MVPILLLLAAYGMLDFEPIWTSLQILSSLVAFGVILFHIIVDGSQMQTMLPDGWMGWIHMVTTLYMLLVGNMRDGSVERKGSAIVLCLMIGILAGNQEKSTTRSTSASFPSSWLLPLLTLPCLCMHVKLLIGSCIVPMIETILDHDDHDAANNNNNENEVLLLFSVFGIYEANIFVLRAGDNQTRRATHH